MGIWLSLRMLRDRIARGEVTGILCPADQVPGWTERLRSINPFLRAVDDSTLYFPTGAVVRFCSTPEEARALGGKSTRPVVWIDEDNVLEASLPAPKPDSGGNFRLDHIGLPAVARPWIVRRRSATASGGRGCGG